jgi:hypothetical protein
VRLFNWKAAASAAILALTIAAPAHAQHIGTRLGKNVEKADLPKAMQIMAECTVKRREPMVRSWLNTLPGSVEEDRIFEKELGDLALCLDDRLLVVDGKTIEVEVGMVRGPLALAMARRELRPNPAAPAASKDAPWFAPKLAGVTESTPVDRLMLGLQDFGHCVAVSDWTNARALILSVEGSAEQTQAVNALVPALGPCLQNDVELKLTPANLRRALAEPMVHMLANASGTATAAR